jgi:hypothetical protein
MAELAAFISAVQPLMSPRSIKELSAQARSDSEAKRGTAATPRHHTMSALDGQMANKVPYVKNRSGNDKEARFLWIAIWSTVT